MNFSIHCEDNERKNVSIAPKQQQLLYYDDKKNYKLTRAVTFLNWPLRARECRELSLIRLNVLPNFATFFYIIHLYRGIFGRQTFDRVIRRFDDNTVWIDQFRYIKIQPNTLDPTARLQEISPTNSVAIPKSLVHKSIVLGWILIYRIWFIVLLDSCFVFVVDFAVVRFSV